MTGEKSILLGPDEGWHYENASVEVWRWGPVVHLAIRSEDSKGKATELTLGEAKTLAEQLFACATSQQRKVRDEPQA